MNFSTRSKNNLSDFKTAAGVDVCYDATSGNLVATAVVMDIGSCALLESATWIGKIESEYISGQFAKRELPPLVNVLKSLVLKPEILLCDAHGVAHPTRNGLACELGKQMNIPSIGCAKTRLSGEYDDPRSARGSYSELRVNEEIIGLVLRTQNEIKPLFVSVGFGIELTTASEIVLKLCHEFRIPEPLRAADHLGKREMKRILQVGFKK